ncbi:MULTISPECIES: CD3072 family TudS-related putative desulfidase [Vagococcus]|uniref:DUF523 domain-containing protein n=1 Tax=Vagococcus fluvialis bH819 TaxID=1255619 RepID=A0A1X6WM04_9ENTE|nr:MULTISPECIES: CD3072 family TudS-related putative desulfidase [Vagococcus]SLM85299.1 hypothetical protein FM121_04325 [Vagococcus fluvialis bH819]HCM89405.1 DUF523 domain-containing protein [Vagococcus sp.]
MKKILYVAHCLLNPSAKLQSTEISLAAEDTLRKKFLLKAIEKDIHIAQLPCPEFTLYGPRRWGHVKDQFDNPFYRKHCVSILTPILDEMEAYYTEKDLFDLIGIVGVDGSPSCGVDCTYRSQCWMGEFSDRENNLEKDLETIQKYDEKGVFMEVLEMELKKRELNIPIIGLYAPDQDKVLSLLS